MISKLAIWSFVLSLVVLIGSLVRTILSLIGLPIDAFKPIIFITGLPMAALFIASVIFGIIALKKIKIDKTLQGKKFAVAALILDGIYVLIFVLGIIAFLVTNLY